ncbi:hypothetical protein QJS10_CPB19g01278 [Acorus calamus]|uniref:Leucine-rich repeat-containing N-terminal plant-type domain-containing protein n=1 Tax=Acorus calamus TaxID=4465 RepID=A0AAV9CJ57_ACOCL|nr:hypothetical protein QJS10_CPB19g01278 [Acorus calamus]
MLEDWVGGGDCCNWTRVECDALSHPYRAVSTIDLSFVRGGFSQDWYLNVSLFGQFMELNELHLSSNDIAGWVNPQDIWHLKNIQRLQLGSNRLNDESIARLIVPWIHNLTSLFELDLSWNNLKEIRWISNITSLSSLDLSGNQIKDFSGFWGLQNLEDLYLSGNQIESVGSWIFNITSARSIDLSDNIIKDLPSDLCQLQDLQSLYLSKNSMKGNIDTCLKSLYSLENLDLSSNQLDGPVPTQICHMQSLHILDLSNNYLSGTIPSCLKNITSWIRDSPIDYDPMLVLVDRSSRDVSYGVYGDPVVTNLMIKESLDLSNNYLSGEIPSQLVKLHSLSVFRVAYNNLSGIIPYNDQFSTFNESSFEGNPGLCGVLIGKNCSSKYGTSQTYHDSSNGDHEDTSKAIDNEVIFYSFIAASFAIGFWGVIAVLAFNKNGRIKFFMAADDFLYACMDVILGLIKRVKKCISK